MTLRFFLLILRANPQSDKEKYLKYYTRRAKIVIEIVVESQCRLMNFFRFLDDIMGLKTNYQNHGK